MTLRHASVSIPVHSQSTISTTTVHGAVVSAPSQLGCSGGGGGESGDGDVALDSATRTEKNRRIVSRRLNTVLKLRCNVYETDVISRKHSKPF